MKTISSEATIPAWMPKLSISGGHISVLFLCALIWYIVHAMLAGPGGVSLSSSYMSQHKFVNLFAIAAAGLYGKYCIVVIPPNHQGIQLFLGMQTGIVWGEGNFHFIPRPFFDIGRVIPIEHVSFTVAAQNRTNEGHLMLLFATGRAEPENVYHLAKIPEKDFQAQLNEQLVGIAMMTLGRYINVNSRETLFRFSQYDITEGFEEILSEQNLYGMKVTLRTTKAVEVNTKTMEQFDFIARQSGMETAIAQLKKLFPLLSEQELYAAYGAQLGLTPAIMAYTIRGQGGNILLDGRGGSKEQ